MDLGSSMTYSQRLTYNPYPERNYLSLVANNYLLLDYILRLYSLNSLSGDILSPNRYFSRNIFVMDHLLIE